MLVGLARALVGRSMKYGMEMLTYKQDMDTFDQEKKELKDGSEEGKIDDVRCMYGQ